MKTETKSFYPSDRQQWREWLQQNHAQEQSVWLIYYKVKSGIPSISWSEAVDEALCFGWIDSTRKSVGDDKFIQFFSRRKPKSVWSKINKEKVEWLTERGLMTAAGHASIETAKRNGSWNILDEAESLIVPVDLQRELNARPGAAEFFDSLSRSVRKAILQWLVLARRPDTRQKRMVEIATLAAQGLKPKQF